MSQKPSILLCKPESGKICSWGIAVNLDISLSVAVSLLPKVESLLPVLHLWQNACAGIINVSMEKIYIIFIFSFLYSWWLARGQNKRYCFQYTDTLTEPVRRRSTQSGGARHCGICTRQKPVSVSWHCRLDTAIPRWSCWCQCYSTGQTLLPY